MKGGGEHPLTVAVRIRPLNEAELSSGGTQVAYKVDDQMAILLDPSDDPDDILRANRSREKRYLFHQVFDAVSTQEEVYQATTRFLIDSVIGGYNGTVFAYGATGAGKTYTMLGTEREPGIYVRALNDLFTVVQEKEEETLHQVSMSYLEIYNEMIRDLLNPASGYLEMREDAKGGVQVSGLSEISTTSTAEIMELLQRGNLERTQEPTKANKTSSRSHAVLQVTVKQRSRVGRPPAVRGHQQGGGGAAANGMYDQMRVGRLFLVDLAGSERAANTQNRGKRMVEGAHINRSLLALGNCINALSEMKGGAASYKYVNYRDSKLTRLLKDALGGNCRTVMIAHVAPASMHFEESRNTLVYADRAKRIKNKVRRNVEDVSYHLTQYTAVIGELKDEISRLQIKLAASATAAAPMMLRPSPSIVAVQDEVMRSAHAHEFFKVKEQLVLVFKEQLELRRTLMQLQNASAEVALEVDRHQLTIADWEAELAAAKQGRETGGSVLDKDPDVSGSSHGDRPEPEEVRAARQELAVLASEQHQTDKKRANVARELAIARQKATVLEESLPKYASSGEQHEIVELLLRVHELEIDNTRVQSELYLKEAEGARKESLIGQYRSHRALADEIIAQQKLLIREHHVPVPLELENAYEAYDAIAPRASLTTTTAAERSIGGSLASIRSQPLLLQQQHQPQQQQQSSSTLRLPPLAQGPSARKSQLPVGSLAAAGTGQAWQRQGGDGRVKASDEEERWLRYQQRGPQQSDAAAAAASQRDMRPHAPAYEHGYQLSHAASSDSRTDAAAAHRRQGRYDDVAFEQRRAGLPTASRQPNQAPPVLGPYSLHKEKTLYSLSLRSSSTESLGPVAVAVGGGGGEQQTAGAPYAGAANRGDAQGTRNIAALAAAKRRRRQEQHDQSAGGGSGVIVRIDGAVTGAAVSAQGERAEDDYVVAAAAQPPALAAPAGHRVVPLLSVSDGYLNRTFVSVSSVGDAASVMTADARSEARTPLPARGPPPPGDYRGSPFDGVAQERRGSNAAQQPPTAHAASTVGFGGWLPAKFGAAAGSQAAGGARQIAGLKEQQQGSKFARGGGDARREGPRVSPPPGRSRQVVSGRRRRHPDDSKAARPAILGRRPSGNVARRPRSLRKAGGRRSKPISPVAMGIVASRPPLEVRRPGKSHLPGRSLVSTQATKKLTDNARPYRPLLHDAAPTVRVRMIQLQH